MFQGVLDCSKIHAYGPGRLADQISPFTDPLPVLVQISYYNWPFLGLGASWPDFPISGPCLRCIFVVRVSCYKWPFPGLGAVPARFPLRLPLPAVRYQCELLATTGYFRAWVSPRPDIPGRAKPQWDLRMFVLIS